MGSDNTPNGELEHSEWAVTAEAEEGKVDAFKPFVCGGRSLIAPTLISVKGSCS